MNSKKTAFIFYFILTLTICVSSINFGTAQTVKDSILMEQSKNNAFNIFLKGINENALIYSGNEYVEYISIESMNQIIKGNPFFITDSLVDGTIVYNGSSYKLPLKFHLLEQKLIINHPITNTPIELLNERVDFFSIGQHLFFKTPKQVSNLISNKQIYAELLLDGFFKIWGIHDKILRPNKKAEEQTATYIKNDQYFVEHNGIFTKIKSEQDVFNLCLDKKRQVQEYAKLRGLDFNKNFESACIQLYKYYETIPN